MKLKVLFCAVFCFLSINVLQAQNLVLPPKIDLIRYIAGDIQVTYPIIESWGTQSDVRIWGWSRDGKIAISQEYITPEYTDPYDGNVKAHISRLVYYILDIINDEIVLEHTWDLSILDYFSGSKPQPLSFDMSEQGIGTLFNLQREAISNANNRHGIIYNQSELLAFPIRNNNFTYNCHAGFTRRIEDERAGYTIDNYDIIVSRNDGKSKKITSNSLYDGDFNFWPNVHVCGYLKSPYENRIVVVHAMECAGLGEGLEWGFNGCSLDIGFN